MPAVRTVAVAWLLTLAPALAVAQASAPAAHPAHPPDLPDPLNAAAPVPPLPDIAPLAGYVPYQSPKVSPWRQSNADVTPGAAPAADPHAGHHMPQGTRAAPASAPAAGQVGQSGHAGHHAH